MSSVKSLGDISIKDVDFVGLRFSEVPPLIFFEGIPKDCLPNNCAILKTCYSMILLALLLSAVIATF